MYSAYSIANALIKRARQGRIPDLGPFKLQKLLFFAQAKHLKAHGLPLFEDTFIRGTHGPVLPSIRHQVKAYRGRPVKQAIRALSGDNDIDNWCTPTVPKEDVKVHRLLDDIAKVYGPLSARALSDLTHLPASAWSLGGADGSPMLNASLRDDPTI